MHLIIKATLIFIDSKQISYHLREYTQSYKRNSRHLIKIPFITEIGNSYTHIKHSSATNNSAASLLHRESDLNNARYTNKLLISRKANINYIAGGYCLACCRTLLLYSVGSCQCQSHIYQEKFLFLRKKRKKLNTSGKLRIVILQGQKKTWMKS